MTHIWVPKVGIIEGEMGFNGGQLAGQYTIKKYKADTDELIQEIGPFDNLITNQGLNRVGTDVFGQNIFIGTGTTVPTVADTQLVNYLNYTGSYAPSGAWNVALLRGGPPDYWVQGAGTWRFPAGAATGTLTEVGIGWGTTASTHRVSSRALIVDSTGSPISITVLPDEYLDVTYALRYYPYIGSDVVQTVTLSGVSYTFTTRALGVQTLNYCSVSAVGKMAWGTSQAVNTGTAPGTPPALAAITATYMLNAGSGTNIIATTNAYVSNSLAISCTLSASLTEGNLAYGIRGIVLAPAYMSSGFQYAFINSYFQSTISPAIPKDNTKILQFGSSITWDRRP